MKVLGGLLLLTILVSCAGPAPQPLGEASVVQPGVVCRVGRDGGPGVADRGIGGTGAPARTQISDRGIGGTGIIGVVTGFASICVDGLEVRLDKTAAVSINGSPATTAQLRVGQLVAIKAAGPLASPDAILQARAISVRYEVSGPVEAIDTGSGSLTVAGQQVMVLQTTWMAGHFGLGNWTTVSGLRQPDGTIIASRLDRAKVGALAVRGQLRREHDVARIGKLILRGPAVATAKTGSFVSIAGKYADMSASIVTLEADSLSDDPVGYFGAAANELIVQAFARVDRGTVWLANGEAFKAGPEVQGNGSGYRNAIVRLKRNADGSFIATQFRYTGYRSQPKEAPARAAGRNARDLLPPPDAPPSAAMDAQPAGATDTDSLIDGTPPAVIPTETPTAPAGNEPTADGAFTAERYPALPATGVRVTASLGDLSAGEVVH